MKSLAKTTLLALYKYSGVMRIQEIVAHRQNRSFLTILLFHRVTDEIPEDGLTVSTRRFRRICRLLQRGFRVVPLAEIFRLARCGAPLPHRTLAITFDDCYRDNLAAARVLAEHSLPACFFIPTAYVGTDHVFDWDRGLKRLANLTWDDLREMNQMGFEIGSHTVTHPNLATLTGEQTRRELIDSKKMLENRLGQRVRWFAYPFGGREHFLPGQLPLVEEAGYEGCVSGHDGFIYPGADARMLPRESILCFHSILHLELYLSGCLSWVYALKRRITPQRSDLCLDAARENCPG